MHITRPGLVLYPVSYVHSGTHLARAPFVPISLKPPDLIVPFLMSSIHFSLSLLSLSQVRLALPFTHPFPCLFSCWDPFFSELFLVCYSLIFFSPLETESLCMVLAVLELSM